MAGDGGDLQAIGTGLEHGPATLDGFLRDIGPRAFRFAEVGLRHREDALDAVQEAMVRMLDYRDRPAREWTPLFWSILRSRIIDAQRRRTFRLSWLLPAPAGEPEVDWTDGDVAHGTDSDPDGPTRHLAGRQAWSRVATVLRTLPARQREAFTLRVFEELDVATTARVMGCSEGAVKTHLSRARENLRRQLEDLR